MKLSELKAIIFECIEEMSDFELDEGPARDYRKLYKTKIKDVTKGDQNVATEPGQAAERLAMKRARRGRPAGPPTTPDERIFNYGPAGGRKPGRGVDIVHVPRGKRKK